ANYSGAKRGGVECKKIEETSVHAARRPKIQCCNAISIRISQLTYISECAIEDRRAPGRRWRRTEFGRRNPVDTVRAQRRGRRIAVGVFNPSRVAIGVALIDQRRHHGKNLTVWTTRGVGVS